MTRPMNPKVKQAWIDALTKSGEYLQGAGALHGGNLFCCLGVLCDLHRKETKAGIWRPDADYLSYLDNISTLPIEVRNWAGLDRADPTVLDPEDGYTTLSALNDSGKTFSEIAKIIEEQF